MDSEVGQIILESNLDYQYNLSAIFIWFIIVLTVGTIASIVPAHHASAISVRESLAYG